MKKLSSADVTLGIPLPWHIYSDSGRLLLRKGYVIDDRRVVQRLMELGAYRSLGKRPPPEFVLATAPGEAGPGATAFQEVAQFKRRLKAIFARLEQANGAEVAAPTLQLARDLQRLCDRNADAALAALHIDLNDHYPICHPLHAAMVTELLARQNGLDTDQRLPLVAGALTHDVGILAMQDELESCRGPLSPTQWEAVRSHPEHGAAMLREHGVSDPTWLFAVAHHHERIDGTGYPAALAGDALPLSARILAIADTFSSMVRPRPYRDAYLARDGLRCLFKERGGKLDGEQVGHLIKAVGVYPPGSLVRLRSGQIGVVTRRGKNAACPHIWAVMYPDGRPLVNLKEVPCDQVVEMLPDHRYRSIWGRLEALFAREAGRG